MSEIIQCSGGLKPVVNFSNASSTWRELCVANILNACRDTKIMFVCVCVCEVHGRVNLAIAVTRMVLLS